MKNRFEIWKRPEFDENGLSKWNWMCQHHPNLQLGKNVDIGAFCYLNAKYGIDIGEDSQIGSHCSIYSISTIDDRIGKVTIGRDVRIGTHSTIMPGVTIGDGAIIGAHSFVNMDIPEGVIAFGVPAKIKEKKEE